MGEGVGHELAVPIEHMDGGLVGAAFGGQPQLRDLGAPHRHDGDSELAGEQVPVMSMVQVCSLVRDDDLPLARRERVEQAP